MNRLKRFLCVLLAVIILFNAPGYVPKAQAVAAVDDAAVIAIGLLMATCAGVTFNRSDHAVHAISNFFSSQPSALAAVSNIASTCLTAAGQLIIKRDFVAAYKTVVPLIAQHFVTAAGTTGTIVNGAVVGASYSVPSCPFGLSSDDRTAWLKQHCTFLSSPDVKYSISVVNVSGKYTLISEYDDSSLLFKSGRSYSSPIDLGTCFTPFFSGTSLFFSYLTDTNSDGVSTPSTRLAGTSATITILSADEESSIAFNQSATVDGSTVSSALDDATWDEDKEVSIGAVTGVVSSGLAGSTAAPGLSPDAITKAIQDAVIALPLPTTPPASEPTTATEPTDEPLVPMDPVTPGFLGDKFSDLNTTLETIKQGFLDVLNSILSVIQTISDGLTRGFAAVTTWLDAFWDTLKQVISDFWSDVVTAVTVTIPTFLGDIADAAVEFFTVTFPAWVADVKAWAVALPATITQAIVAALTAVFVPAAGYWDAKVAACTAAFPLFNSIIATGHGLSGFLSGLGTRPPVIYIDLGSSTSWFLGGRQIFLDLTWYSQYKPTMDLVISGFLWLLFAWRFFLRLPGLLRGEGGTIDRLNTYFDNKGDNR